MIFFFDRKNLSNMEVFEIYCYRNRIRKTYATWYFDKLTKYFKVRIEN